MTIQITPQPGAPATIHQATSLKAELLEINNGNYLAQLRSGQVIAVSANNCQVCFDELLSRNERTRLVRQHQSLLSNASPLKTFMNLLTL